ncbi:beta-phosphoglucomutase [Lacticaseibacillus baoqingensis]|uniref:Beta-phosphoglucomutase n=1 Tax=Lacticaseibacillus baoqingensis TaxID=2486013 RepID=A0ABW4E4N4_9LACO|nr:beta-phosphoglucomutase [Lacticaseibacillus baoqingensis]
MLKGLIFDLDGVLTDSAAYHLQAWNDLAKSIGITLPPAANDALRGRSRMDSLDLILAYGRQQTHYTLAQKQALAASKNTHYQALIKQMTPADILPGIVPLLDAARAAGLQLAIASASKNAPTILTQLGLMDRFAGIVDPDSLQHGKPDPEIFIKAAETLHLAADEVMSFEDASAGVAAIKAAHQFAVGIGDATVLAAADVVVPTTAALNFAALQQAFTAQ